MHVKMLSKIMQEGQEAGTAWGQQLGREVLFEMEDEFPVDGHGSESHWREL